METKQALARAAGVRGLTPQLADVNRRRAQLWLLSLLVGLALPAALLVTVLGVVPPPTAELLAPIPVRAGLAALVVVVGCYVVQRERSLRRLEGLLVDERTLTAALVARVGELDLLLAASRAMNSSLELDEVLGIILTSASELLQASEGSIALVRTEDRGELEIVAVAGASRAQRGQRQAFGEGLAGRVAERGESLVVVGPHDASTSARRGCGLVVPLLHRDELVGVLNLFADGDAGTFTEAQLRSVSLFAETAASAISNARLHGATEAAVAALTELDRLKDEFLALVTHELRTPLTSVIGLAQTIERGAGRLAPAKLAELALNIRRQGWRLDRLVDDLLRSCQLQTGLPALLPERLDVTALVTEIVEGIRPAAPDHRVVLAAPPGPVLRVLDGDAVSRVVGNLVGNAVKYTPEGTVVTVAVDAGEPDRVVLIVDDDGPGIPEAEWEHVFAKFRRGEGQLGLGAGGLDSGGGLGLGLYLVRALAEAHGGGAVLSRSPGGGCRFVVTLQSLPERVPVAAKA